MYEAKKRPEPGAGQTRPGAPPEHAAARPAQNGYGPLQAAEPMVRLRPAAPGATIQRKPYIVQAGYMSGDMYGISAALVLDRSMNLLLLKEQDAELKKERVDQSDSMETFYKDGLTGNRPQRVVKAEVADTREVFKGLTDHPPVVAAKQKVAAKVENPTFFPPGKATSIVGEEFQANAGQKRQALKQSWLGANPTNHQLLGFLNGKGIKPGKRYAFLWVRFSKKKPGGAHTELDTSNEGLRELKKAFKDDADAKENLIKEKEQALEEAQGKGEQAISDAQAQLDKAKKATGREVVLIGESVKPDVSENAIDLTKFWEDPIFAGTGRNGQLRMFSYLKENGYDVVNIGMRSGALEGPALLGIPTIYLEEAGNEQAERMEKWIGKVPGYTRHKLKLLPTRTGKRYQVERVMGAAMRKLSDDIANYNHDLRKDTAAWLFDMFDNLAKDTTYAGFEAAYLTRALPGWYERYGDANLKDLDKFKQYQRSHQQWWTPLAGMLKQWYDRYFAQKKGFDPADVKAIVEAADALKP